MNDTISNPPAPAGMPPAGPGVVDGERHVSEVAGRGPAISKRAGIGVIIAGAAIACGVIVLTAERPNLKPDAAPPMPRSVVRYEAPAQPYVAPPPPAPPPSLPSQPMFASGSPAAAAAPPPRPARLLVYTSGSGHTSAGLSAASPGAAAASPGAGGALGAFPGLPGAAGGLGAQGPQGGEDLQARLTPTRLTGVSANVLRNPSYLLTMGTVVSCILQTAMDSTLPGFVTCVVPQDVQGKTGLTLLDRGTKVVGEFRGGVRQGIERLFVVWTRAETPQGVVINFDSPATDPLGRSGMEGDVDRHFWQRFGGALLLTTVDGVIQAGVASASKSGTTTINTGQAQSIVAETLRSTINIPPTIRKNQGELVSIFIARDLDFSTVYRVQPSLPRYVAEQAATEPARGTP